MLGAMLEISRAMVLEAASWVLAQLADGVAFVTDRVLGTDEEEQRVEPVTPNSAARPTPGETTEMAGQLRRAG